MTTDQWQWLAILVLSGCGGWSYMVAWVAADAAQDALRALRIRGIVCLQCNNPVIRDGDEFCGDACEKARAEARREAFRAFASRSK